MLLVLAVLGLVLYLLVSLKLLMVPCVIALIVAAALQPLMSLLKPRMPHGLAAAITLLLGGVGLGGVVAYVVMSTLSRLDTLQSAVVKGLQQAVNYLHSGALPISDKQIADIQSEAVNFVTSKQFGAEAVAGAYGAAQLVLSFVLSLFVLFYLLKDGTKIWEFLTRPLSPTLRDNARYSGRQGMIVLGGYLRGTAVVTLVDTVLIGGALWLLGVPLAMPLAMLVFIGGFVPIVGATASGAIAALVALVTVDLSAALWVSGVVLAVNQLESNLLSPLVLGKWMHLHALVVLLALSAGAILGGITGTFLAVPLTAMAWTMINSWNRPSPDQTAETTDSAGPSLDATEGHSGRH